MKIDYFNMAGKVKAYTHKRRADRAVNRAFYLGESSAKLETVELHINRESLLAAFVAGAKAAAGDAAITLDGAGE